MISCIQWIPKGAMAAEPRREEEGAGVAEAAEELRAAAEAGAAESDEAMDTSDEEAGGGDDAEDAAEQVSRAKSVAKALKEEKGKRKGAGADVSALLAELNMDAYDDEEDGLSLFAGGTHPGGAMHLDPRDDPYLQGGESDSDSSVEDFEVKPTDNVVLAARNEDDVSHLEVYVYELDAGGESNLYVHHDIMLPAFPLTLAWTDFRPQSGGAKGSLVAVGAMSPAIELWDLDVLDAVEPVAVLGGVAGPEEVAGAGLDKKEKKKAKKKARKKAGKLRGGSHEDAVMALSWNPVFRNGLASGSADGTAKLWDLERGACHATLRHHAGKVQAVAWNAHEGHVLLTAAFDKRACVVDARAPGGDVPTWELTADVEAVAWDPTRPTAFYASTEDGLVACYDARVGPGGGALFRLQAHDSACCSLSVNAALPGLVATAGTDKKVKLWDVRDDKPGLIVAEDLKCGAVFTAGFAASDPLLLAAGGAKGLLSIWDVSTSAAVQKRYAGEIKSLRG